MYKNIEYTHPQIQENIRKDISYLSEFKNHSVVEDESGCCWRYCYETPSKNYKILCVIKRNFENIWFLKIHVYWLKFSNRFTQGEGKDVEHSTIPIKGYKNFINQANLKLKNNLIADVKMYDDDYGFEMDRQIIKMIIELIKKFPEMDNLNFKYYDDLKKIYQDIIHKSGKEVLEYIQKEYPKDTDKQFLLIRLDSLKSVDNFHRMNKMKLNPSI